MSRSWLEKKFGRIGGMSTVWLGCEMVIVSGNGHRESEAVLAVESSDNPVWAASVQALQRLLGRQSMQSFPKRLKIVVSNEFVRYVLAPWTEGKLNESERVELVRALLTDRYGERDSHWHVVIEPQRFQTPALAAAIDAGLVEALQDLCRQMNLRLVSMKPALIENLNTQRRRLAKAKQGWYVDAGDGRLAILAFAGTGLTSVANERAGGQTAVADMLLPMLRRDAIRKPDLLDGTVFITNGRGAMESISECWPVVRLNGMGQETCA